jgi:hypothetical protein
MYLWIVNYFEERQDDSLIKVLTEAGMEVRNEMGKLFIGYVICQDDEKILCDH